MNRYRQYIPYATVTILAINVIVFLICTFTGDLLYSIGNISPFSFLKQGRYYQIITAMFLHADVEHIANNMLLLFGLGYLMEETLGHFWFPTLYITTGLIGNIASLWYKVRMKEWFVYSLGASGAVFGMEGVLLAYALFAPGKIRSASWERILIVLAFSVYAGIRSNARIDNAAHIGGLVSGFFLGALVSMIQQNREDKKCRDMAGRYGSRVV